MEKETERRGEKKNISLDQEELVKKKTRKKSWSIKQKIRRCGLKKRLDSVHFPIKGKKGWAFFGFQTCRAIHLKRWSVFRRNVILKIKLKGTGGGMGGY